MRVSITRIYIYVSGRRIVKISLGKSNESDRIFTCVRMRAYVPRKYVLRRNESLFSVYRTRWYFRCKSISWNTGPLAWSNTYNITSGDFQFNGSNLIEEWWLKNRGTINLIGFRNILFLLFREKVRFELINNYTFSRQMK